MHLRNQRSCDDALVVTGPKELETKIMDLAITHSPEQMKQVVSDYEAPKYNHSLEQKRMS